MPGRALTLLAIALLAAPAGHADTAQVERLFLERTAISAADASCNLFTESERLALKAGLYQTEGELLRANYSPEKLASLAKDVRAHAKSLGCDHPSVLEVASTIRSSYRAFTKTIYLDYVAAHSSWGASRAADDAWGVVQEDKASGVKFGLRRGDEFEDLKLAITMPAKGAQPSSVQLIMRDAKKMADPWVGKMFGADGSVTLPPRSVTRPEWAGDEEDGTDGRNNPTWIYYFSQPALDRLEGLDPREMVQIELTPSPRAKDQKPVRIVFETGDLRAAHAFSLIPKPAASALAAAEPAKPAH